MLCCGYTLTDFPISIRLTSLALWQSNDCPSASKATLMYIWINTSCEFIMNDCITTTKQSTTKPCAYFLGYTVSLMETWWRHDMEIFSTSLGTYVYPTVGDGFFSKRAGNAEFDEFIVSSTNVQFIKQSIFRWFETPWRGNDLPYSWENLTRWRQKPYHMQRAESCTVAFPDHLRRPDPEIARCSHWLEQWKLKKITHN